MNIHALGFFMASAMSARSTAAFTVTSTSTAATTSSMENVGFMKQWTLNAANTADIIDTIDLNLAGRVYVTHMSGIPSGILGYVNVSGNSQTVVDAVTASNDDINESKDNDENDNDDANETNGNGRELNVRIGNSASTSPDGYLLTEIVLASNGVVTDVTSQRSAQVVIEDGVLVTSSTTAELQIEASGSSAVFVSSASTAVTVRQLHLYASGSASLQFNVISMSVLDEAQFESQGSASISLLSSSLDTVQLELDAQNTGTICINAQQVTAKTHESKGGSSISMPNAAKKYGTTGSFACNEATVPAREASNSLSSSPGTSTNGGATNGGATTNNVSNNTSAASIPQVTALAIGFLGVTFARFIFA